MQKSIFTLFFLASFFLISISNVLAETCYDDTLKLVTVASTDDACALSSTASLTGRFNCDLGGTVGVCKVTSIIPGICIDSKYNLWSDSINMDTYVRGSYIGGKCVASYDYTCSWVSGQEYWKGGYGTSLDFTPGSSNAITTNFEFGKNNCADTGAYNCGEAKIEVTYKKCCPDGYEYKSDKNACEEIPGKITTCTDSDNGKNYAVKGTCTDATGSYSDTCYYDKSKESYTGQSLEYYCDSTSKCASSVSPQCPNGCSEGVCQGLGLEPTRECVGGGTKLLGEVCSSSQECCSGFCHTGSASIEYDEICIENNCKPQRRECYQDCGSQKLSASARDRCDRNCDTAYTNCLKTCAKTTYTCQYSCAPDGRYAADSQACCSKQRDASGVCIGTSYTYQPSCSNAWNEYNPITYTPPCVSNCISISISPKSATVYSNHLLKFTVNLTNLDTDKTITINSPEYYNSTVRMSVWESSTINYTDDATREHMMGKMKSFLSKQSRTFTLYIKAPNVTARTVVDMKVSATGSSAEDTAQIVVEPQDIQFNTFIFSGNLDYFNVFWNVSYRSGSNRNIAVKCALNCPTTPNSLEEIDNCIDSGQGQKCMPYPYIQSPGTGSCSVPNPQYRFLTKNEIKCVAYDPANTVLQTVSE